MKQQLDSRRTTEACWGHDNKKMKMHFPIIVLLIFKKEKKKINNQGSTSKCFDITEVLRYWASPYETVKQGVGWKVD